MVLREKESPKETVGISFLENWSHDNLADRPHCGDNIAITITTLDTPREIRDITSVAKSIGFSE